MCPHCRSLDEAMQFSDEQAAWAYFDKHIEEISTLGKQPAPSKLK
ncbi:MAG: hypothetical protein HoeaKO_32970 [Hoeflea alexandrii]